MPSQGISAFGTLLKIGDGAGSESFATIAEVTNLDWSGMKLTMVDITNHSSSNAAKEVAPGTIDPGQIKLSVNFIPGAVTQGYTVGLIRDFVNRNKRNFQMVFPTSPTVTWPFTGYVSSLDIKAPVDGKLAADFAIDVTGLPAYA